MRLPFRLGAAVLAVPLALASPALPAQEADGGPAPRIVTVVGHGTVEAVPDVADIVTGVVTREKTARAAIDGNSAAMEKLIAALRAAGIADRDVRTSGFGLTPQYSRARNDRSREIAGYQASNQVTVTIRDIRQVGAVIDRVIGAGSNSVTGVRFGIANPDALMDEARRKAMAEARRLAGLLAAAAGAEVGRVLRIEEVGGRMPQPRMTMMEARVVPVAPGTEEVVASVSVQYELR
jgi:uncharacterized protein YggE